MTDTDTRAYWEENNYFGLPRADVTFFSQGTLPCLDNSG
jgi:UDP-N-acetylglucosamine pyrophosphorylase